MLESFDYGDIAFNISNGVDETATVTNKITNKTDIAFNITNGVDEGKWRNYTACFDFHIITANERILVPYEDEGILEMINA
ncbi:Uncharacterized protein FWK35_00034941, partial [Aphis craccivora]